MCLGQNCGIEHAIHALRKAYESPEVEGVLLIDAQNAFNSLNRELALKILMFYVLPYPKLSETPILHHQTCS